MASRFRQRLRDDSGTSMVEAALITPLLLLLTFAIVDFGAVFYAYLALENGVSLATRYAVTGNKMDDPMNPGTPLSREATIKAAMRQATPTLTIADNQMSFAHRAPGAGAWVAGVGGPGELEKLSVSYTWTFMTPVVAAFFTNGQLSLQVDSAMKNEGFE
jgi:Flp pilus assembly protein TadG